jgi:hypothetical protein
MNPSAEDMKHAKKQVLMVHPDKSKLPPEYFLFYKKAFDLVLNHYNNINKQNQAINDKTTKYVNLDDSKQLKTQISQNIEEMQKNGKFQEKFNELFEKNMLNKEDEERKKTQNEWFLKNDPLYSVEGAVNLNNMGEKINQIKQNTQNIIKYQGVQDFFCSRGAQLYEGEEDHNQYATCDPFAKLKFDDLRRVHKDETVFNVSENDYNNVKKYESVDHYVRERNVDHIKPLDKLESQKIFDEKERNQSEKLYRLNHQSNIKTLEYEKKNAEIKSAFLYLT